MPAARRVDSVVRRHRPVGDAAWEARNARLNGNTKTLYHATSSAAYAEIMKHTNGLFLRGSDGVAGGGVYFAESEADAKRKARASADIILTCEVRVGNHLVQSRAPYGVLPSLVGLVTIAFVLGVVDCIFTKCMPGTAGTAAPILPPAWIVIVVVFASAWPLTVGGPGKRARDLVGLKDGSPTLVSGITLLNAVLSGISGEYWLSRTERLQLKEYFPGARILQKFVPWALVVTSVARSTVAVWGPALGFITFPVWGFWLFHNSWRKDPIVPIDLLDPAGHGRPTWQRAIPLILSLASGLLCRSNLPMIIRVTRFLDSSSKHRFTTLLNAGYDSVLVTWTHGNEWVVYNCDQIRLVGESRMETFDRARPIRMMLMIQTLIVTMIDDYTVIWASAAVSQSLTRVVFQ